MQLKIPCCQVTDLLYPKDAQVRYVDHEGPYQKIKKLIYLNFLESIIFIASTCKSLLYYLGLPTLPLYGNW